jgi:RNA polymerase sigma factor (sigma-70 family)
MRSTVLRDRIVGASPEQRARADAVLRDNAKLVYSTTNRIAGMKNEQDREDITQEGLIGLWVAGFAERDPRFEHSTLLVTSIFRRQIGAITRLQNQTGRRRPTHQILTETDVFKSDDESGISTNRISVDEDLVDTNHLMEQVESILEKSDFEIVRMRHIESQPIKVIAKKTGRTQRRIHQILFRSLGQLRSHLNKDNYV